MEPSAPIVLTLPGEKNAGAGWAILIDFDLCILESDKERGGACVAPAVRDTLSRLFQTFGGAVALVTRRSLLEVDRMIGLPDLPVAASNGLEMRALRKAPAAPLFANRAFPRRSRGDLVAALMSAAPFKNRIPVYIGGSPGDESAYDTAAALGGFGVNIGYGPTAAAATLASPRIARSLLRRWAEEPRADART